MGVLEQVVADDGLIGFDGNDVFNHPARGQLQGSHAGIKRQHFAGDGLEGGHIPPALPHQGAQGIGGAQRPLDALLDVGRVVARQVADLGTLPVQLNGRKIGNQPDTGDSADQKGQASHQDGTGA